MLAGLFIFIYKDWKCALITGVVINNSIADKGHQHEKQGSSGSLLGFRIELVCCMPWEPGQFLFSLVKRKTSLYHKSTIENTYNPQRHLVWSEKLLQTLNLEVPLNSANEIFQSSYNGQATTNIYVAKRHRIRVG